MTIIFKWPGLRTTCKWELFQATATFTPRTRFDQNFKPPQRCNTFNIIKAAKRLPFVLLNLSANFKHLLSRNWDSEPMFWSLQPWFGILASFRLVSTCQLQPWRPQDQHRRVHGRKNLKILWFNRPVLRLHRSDLKFSLNHKLTKFHYLSQLIVCIDDRPAIRGSYDNWFQTRSIMKRAQAPGCLTAFSDRHLLLHLRVQFRSQLTIRVQWNIALLALWKRRD